MTKSNLFSEHVPRGALGRLILQTHAIQEAVVKSLVGQGHQHMLENTRNLEQALFSPVSRMPDSAPQEKGHRLQAWMHLSRIDSALAAFDQESRRRFASQPDARTSLQTLAQRNEQLATRVEERNTLLERRAAWAAPTSPPSCEVDPIAVPVLLAAPLNNRLTAQELEQAVKHVNALDKETGLLDQHIQKQPQPLSQVEENIFIRQRNAITEYRNAWATGRLKGSSQFKTTMGLIPERKRLEQNLERNAQSAPVELTLHRLERTVESAHRNGLGEKLSPDAINAARDALGNLRDAWHNGSLDGSSVEGMNPMLVLTSPNKRRIKLELAVIENGFVQLNTIPRTEQAGNEQDRQDFKALIHSANNTHVKLAAIGQLKENNKQRSLVAELNTDLRNLYTDLRNDLALHRMTTSHQ
ncbi:hypothetical protein [Pseudomonas sp.]|uniref:hypothetical protein n=1 Tax=Pseudomonas sp. TaxID=306 RepID=UPI003D6DF104